MVKSGRRFGWIVLAAMVAAVVVAAPVMAQTLSVTADRVNLRAKPTTDSAVVATVERGAELTVIETAGSWYKVRDKVSGKEGYVHSLTVKVTGDSRPPAPPSAAAPAAPAPRPPARVAPRPVEPAAGASDEKKMQPVVMAGLITGGGSTTWALGGGIGFKPFSNPKIRLQGDLLWNREKEKGEDDSVNVFLFSGNGHYLFEAGNMKPYAGGGIVWAKATCNGCENASAFGFSVVGGSEFKTGNLDLRAEARILIVRGTTLFAILGGISF
jgi:hypothetical protein